MGMTRTRIGLDIGASGVRAAEVSMRSIPPALVRVAQAPMPEDAFSGGEVKDPEAVAEAIRELWHRGKFKSREVVLGVANQRVVVREVSVPWLAEKELKESLPYQVQEFVPIPLEDAVLDFHILEEFEHEGHRMLRLLLVVAQRQMIDQVVQAAQAAKLTPIGMDLTPFAIVRSVGSIEDRDMDTVAGDEAIVDIGSEVTSICVHAWGVPRFVRILPSGGRDVTAAVARAMGVDENEAERLKRGPDSWTAAEQEQASGAVQVATSRATTFADEIRSSLDFYLTQMPGARVSRILLTGGGSKLPGLIDLLSERLPAEVKQGHPFHRVQVSLDLSPETAAEAEPLLAVAVGLALPGVRG
jgi:type IV pilus assembly protein PilM